MEDPNQQPSNPLNAGPGNLSQDTNFAGNTDASGWSSVPQNQVPPQAPAPANNMGQAPVTFGAPNFANPGSPLNPPPNNYSVVGGKKSLGSKSILSWLLFIILAVLIVAGTGYYVLFYSRNPNTSIMDAINMLLGKSTPADNTLPNDTQLPVIPAQTEPVVTNDTAPIQTDSTSLEDDIENIKPENLDDFEGIQVN